MDIQAKIASFSKRIYPVCNVKIEEQSKQNYKKKALTWWEQEENKYKREVNVKFKTFNHPLGNLISLICVCFILFFLRK